MKKRKGNVVDVLGSLIAIVAMCILFMSLLYLFAGFDRKEDVRQASRDALLKMETTGYLTPGDEAMLRQRLSSLGCTGIDLSGTSMSPVGYGNTVELRVVCSVPVTIADVPSGGLFGTVYRGSSRTVVIRLTSTAKY